MANRNPLLGIAADEESIDHFILSLIKERPHQLAPSELYNLFLEQYRDLNPYLKFHRAFYQRISTLIGSGHIVPKWSEEGLAYNSSGLTYSLAASQFL